MAFVSFSFVDGKLYDAYISYVNNEYDRKFVNFILKPNLAKYGQRLHLNDNDILPGTGDISLVSLIFLNLIHVSPCG